MKQSNTKLCRCGRHEIMTGTEAQYNAKSKDGSYICTECFIDEIYAAQNPRSVVDDT